MNTLVTNRFACVSYGAGRRQEVVSDQIRIMKASPIVVDIIGP